MKKKNDDFVLVGHLQVLDEALSSLYSDRSNGEWFIFVRVYEDTDDGTYVLAETKPSIVLDYMNGSIGLTSIFSSSPSFYYRTSNNNHVLKRSDFIPIDNGTAEQKLKEDALDDHFDKALADNSVGIKRYLKEYSKN